MSIESNWWFYIYCLHKAMILMLKVDFLVVSGLCRYHSLHHQEMGTNFCLFMPLFDVLGNTQNPNSWELQKKIRLSAGI